MFFNDSAFLVCGGDSRPHPDLARIIKKPLVFKANLQNSEIPPDGGMEPDGGMRGAATIADSQSGVQHCR